METLAPGGSPSWLCTPLRDDLLQRRDQLLIMKRLPQVGHDVSFHSVVLRLAIVIGERRKIAGKACKYKVL
jgi:hypothetical protein